MYEAILNSCFIIASNVCDHPCLIGDNERGILCDPNSPLSICRAIENLYSLPIKRKVEMINRANSFATEFFDVNLMSRKYEKLIKSDG